MKAIHFQKPQGLSLLYLMGVLDVIVLVGAYLMVSDMETPLAGFEIDLPSGGQSLTVEKDAIFLNVSGQFGRPLFSLGDQIFERESLASLLKEEASSKKNGVLYLGLNRELSAEVQSEIFNLCSELGLRCVLVSDENPASQPDP